MEQVFEDQEEFGRRVAAARGYAGMLRPAFAEHMPFGKETLRRIETGQDEKEDRTPEERKAILRVAAGVSGTPLAWLTADFSALAEAPRFARLERQMELVLAHLDDLDAEELAQIEADLDRQFGPSNGRLEEEGDASENG